MSLTVWQRNIVDETGDIVPGASVEVRRESDSALATLYDNVDGTGTPLANPLTADVNGFVQFYTAAGAHRITATSGAFTATWRHEPFGDAQNYRVGVLAAADLPTRDDADARYLMQSQDLADLDDAATARTNLGLGTAAVLDEGTDPDDLPDVATVESIITTYLATLSSVYQPLDATLTTLSGLGFTGNDTSDIVMSDGPTLVSPVDINPADAEAGLIHILGVDVNYDLRVNDIGNNTLANVAIHKHSTTFEPVLIGLRSNTNDDTHAIVTAGMNVFSLFAGGWCTTQYNPFASISFAAGATGTISDTSAPGRIDFNVSRDGAITPTLAMRINEVGFVGVNTEPAARLHSKGVNEIIRLETTGATGANYFSFWDAAAEKAYVGFGSSGNDDFSIANKEAGVLRFLTTNTERARFAAGGARLMVATTTDDGTSTIQAAGDIAATGTIKTTASGVVTDAFAATGATTDRRIMRLGNTGGDFILGIDDNAGGTTIVGATAYDAILRGPSGISFSANGGSALHMRLTSTGNLHVSGDQIGIATAQTPASAAAAGVTGTVCWDASYIYVCTATNTWKRTAIATW